MRSISPGAKPISFSSRADSWLSTLRVTRVSFQSANLPNIFVIIFAALSLYAAKAVVRGVSENIMDITSLSKFILYAALILSAHYPPLISATSEKICITVMHIPRVINLMFCSIFYYSL